MRTQPTLLIHIVFGALAAIVGIIALFSAKGKNI